MALLAVAGFVLSSATAKADSLPEVVWVQEVSSQVVGSVAFSPNKGHVAVGGWDHSVQARRFSDGALVKKWASNNTGHDDPVNAVVFIGNDQVASAASDMTIKVHRISDGQRLFEFVGHADIVVSLAVTPDGKRLISGSLDKTIKIWNLETGLVERTVIHTEEVNSISVSPDGATFAAGGYDTSAPYQSNIRLIRISDGALVRTIAVKPENGVNSVSFSPDGNQVACGLTGNLNLPPGEDPADIQVFITANGSLLQTLRGHEMDVLQLAYFPGGKIIASCAFDDTIAYWNVATGQMLERHVEDTFFIRTLAVSGDGSHLAYGTDDGYLFLIEAPIFLTETSMANGQLTLKWDGGIGPFQVQKRGTLGQAWQNVGGILNTRQLIDSPTGSQSFYRVVKTP